MCAATTAATTASGWLKNRDPLRSALVKAQEARAQRREFVVLEDGSSEVGWIIYEHQTVGCCRTGAFGLGLGSGALGRTDGAMASLVGGASMVERGRNAPASAAHARLRSHQLASGRRYSW